MKHTGTSHGRSEASGPNISNILKNKIKHYHCGRCDKLFPVDELKMVVKSTRHEYKGRKDNPDIYSLIQFFHVEDDVNASLCLKCREKTISEMYNGGNWR